MEKFTFFWSGPFSQWYPSNFVSEQINYNCAEQYMMYQKAMFFGDHKSAERILETVKPSEQKALGRQVKNFDLDKWNQVAKEIVYNGNHEKFRQNKDLYKSLMDTVGTTLVEASPYDKIWGIGLKENDPRALNRNSWMGSNWLGEILTQLRQDLLDLDDNSNKINHNISSKNSKKVEAHIRKHMTFDENGKIQIQETLVPERDMMPIEEYAQLYSEKMNVDLVNGVRIIHPDDYQCYELQNGVWNLVKSDT